MESMAANGYHFGDGILAKIMNRRGRVCRVVVVGESEPSFVIEDGNGNYSHGKTLAEARDGLLYKLSDRDTSRFAKWTTQTVVTLADAIQAYRAITGACEAGTKHFCQQQGELPEKLSIANAIKRTAGQYGHEQFAAFFSRKQAAA